MIGELAKVGAHGGRRAEMREKKRFGVPTFDRSKACGPRVEIDVGRRRRRKHVGPSPEADAGRVADERDSRIAAEI